MLGRNFVVDDLLDADAALAAVEGAFAAETDAVAVVFAAADLAVVDADAVPAADLAVVDDDVGFAADLAAFDDDAVFAAEFVVVADFVVVVDDGVGDAVVDDGVVDDVVDVVADVVVDVVVDDVVVNDDDDVVADDIVDVVDAGFDFSVFVSPVSFNEDREFINDDNVLFEASFRHIESTNLPCFAFLVLISF